MERLEGIWGLPELIDHNRILKSLSEMTYDLRSAQKEIEKHLWKGEVSSRLYLEFAEIDFPGYIEYSTSYDVVRGVEISLKIRVSNEWRKSPQAQMAILAHENSHAFHYLLDSFPTPADLLEYENLTDLSAVCLGMGKMLIEGAVTLDKAIYSRIMTFGYLPRELLLFAQEKYEERLKSKGSFRKSSISDLSLKGPTEKIEHRPYHEPLNRIELYDEKTGSCLLLNVEEKFGRKMLKKLVSGLEEYNKVSREQLFFTQDDGTWFLHNCGKHQISVFRKSEAILGIIPRFWESSNTTIEPGKSVPIEDDDSIILPRNIKISFRTV